MILGRKATKVLYPDDPSNVHHSYIGDHVKMRVVHAGPKEHHIHHLHAHQWLQTPDDDNSTYLDSQALGPGYAFTTEIAHGGSGNRNQTVGDSIFHCHFYPHFAEGMWELWRSHDVFEAGTVLDANGIPVAGRARLTRWRNHRRHADTGAGASADNSDGADANGNRAGLSILQSRGGRSPPTDIRRSTRLMTAVCRVTSSLAELLTTSKPVSISAKNCLTAIAQAIPEAGSAAEIAAMVYHETASASEL